MRKILFIGLLFCCFSSGFAQKTVLSEKEEINLKNDDFMVIGQFKNLTALYKNHTGIGEIMFYNKQFQKEKISTLSFLPNFFNRIYFSCTKSELAVFYIVNENKRASIFTSSLKEDFSWSEPRLLDQTSSGSYRNNSEIMFCSSEDHSKTMWYNRYTSNEKSMIHIGIANSNGQLLTQLDEGLPEPDMVISDISAISNTGEAFISVVETKNPKANSSKYSLIHAGEKANKLDYIPFNLQEFSIHDVHLAIDNKNKLIYTCAYFAVNRFSAAKGIYMSKYNFNTFTSNGSFFTPITLQITDSKSDLTDLAIRNIFLTESGNVSVVAERTYQTVRTISNVSPMMSSSYMTMGESSRTVHEFNYDEIVVFNLKSDGSLAWSQTVLKDQTTSEDNGIYSSYGVLQHKLGNAFLFNDVSSKNWRLLASYVASNGELTVKELQTSFEIDDWNLMPRSAVQISNSEIVMPCVSKSYLCFLKISY